MSASKIFFLFRAGRSKLLNAFNSGQSPSDFLYGFTEVIKVFTDAELKEFRSREDTLGERWIQRIGERFDHLISKFFLCNIRLSIALHYWPLLCRSKVVVTNIDSIGFSLALLKLICPFDCRILHISQGLTNKIDSGTPHSFSFIDRLKCWMTSGLSGQFCRLIVLGEGAKKSYLRCGLIRDREVGVIQFGVDVGFWSTNMVDQPRVTTPLEFALSVGSDAGRDYAVFRDLKLGLPLKIVTRLEVEENEMISKVSDISDSELRAYYTQAKFVVIPLKEIPQPTGQSATLQAMACGKSVILTQTKGFWEHEHFKNRENVFFVASGDLVGLQNLISELEQNDSLCNYVGDNARQLVREHFSMAHFGKTLSGEIQSVRMVGRDLAL